MGCLWGTCQVPEGCIGAYGGSVMGAPGFHEDCTREGCMWGACGAHEGCMRGA